MLNTQVYAFTKGITNFKSMKTTMKFRNTNLYEKLERKIQYFIEFK